MSNNGQVDGTKEASGQSKLTCWVNCNGRLKNSRSVSARVFVDGDSTMESTQRVMVVANYYFMDAAYTRVRVKQKASLTAEWVLW